VPREAFRHSRATLAEHGNIASVTVLDALRRLFDEGMPDGATGLLAGFGPGITAEMCLGTWRTRSPVRGCAAGDAAMPAIPSPRQSRTAVRARQGELP